MGHDVKKILLLGDAIDGMELADLWSEWNNDAETFKVKSASEIENSAEMLVIGQGALSAMTPELGRAVREYVERGGFCWIWHQDERARLEWLPETLRGITLEPRYLRLDPNLKYNYLTPWITDRAHPVWNQPHYLDEGRFVFWDVTVEGMRYESTASHVLRQRNWNVLGRFVNPAVRPEENVALIAEAEAKGLARLEKAELAAVDPPLLAALARREDRRLRCELTLSGDHLYLAVNGEHLDGPLHRGRVGAGSR